MAFILFFNFNYRLLHCTMWEWQDTLVLVIPTRLLQLMLPGLSTYGFSSHANISMLSACVTDGSLCFQGISSYSTVLSGILMFIITYASPMLALLTMLMDVSMMDTRAAANSRNADFGHVLKMTLGYPCLVPLALNSILLVAYTIVLLLMRNHLFVWSVFSPK